MSVGKAGFQDEGILGESEFKDGKLGSSTPLAQPRCPECAAQRVWKDGLRYTKNGDVQRYLCRGCGYRFSETQIKVNIGSQVLESSKSDNDLAHDVVPSLDSAFKESVDDCSLLRCKDVASHSCTVVGQRLNSFRDYNSTRRVCVSNHEMKNLVKVETRQKQAAGATRLDEATVKGKFIEFAWYLKKDGKRESTIKTYSDYLNLLNKVGEDIFNSESVKETIAEHFTDRNTKRLAVCVYTSFLKFLGKTWDKPKYKPEEKPIFIPTDQELQLAVNSGHKENIAFSQLGYETGARYNEAERLEWTDIDAERCKTTIKSSKHGKARTLTVSRDLIGKLLGLPKVAKTVFPRRARNTRRLSFSRRMKRLARAHNNPRLAKIHYHTFRHCKALREYHKTRSILHVKRVLGHRSILTTQRYVELYTEVYGDLMPENYVCETASTVEEARKLIESGFEYVSTIDGEQLYRKVK